MVKFAAAGYVCVDYYPDFNNRYYITGNGVDVLFNLLDIKKGKDMEASIISAVSDDEYWKRSGKNVPRKKYRLLSSGSNTRRYDTKSTFTFGGQ